MISADLVRACLLSTLPAAYLLGTVTLGQLYAVALLTGAAGVLFNTAYPPFFVRLVPRSSYVDANSRLSASRSASYVVGPALGGVLVQALTAPIAVVTDALSFLVSAVLVGSIPISGPPAASGDAAAPSLLRSAREGLAFVVRHPILRASLGCGTTVNFFSFIASSGLIVLFAGRTLGLSPGAIGLALGVGATGALLGAVTAPRISRRIGVGRGIALGAVLFPAPFAIAACASGPAWARAGVLGVAEFLSGVGVMLFDVNLNSLQAAVIPDDVRSRVAGAYSTVNYGIRPLGAITGGLLATLIGLRATLLIAAIGGALSLLWLLPSPIPRIRSLAPDDPADRLRADCGENVRSTRLDSVDEQTELARRLDSAVQVLRHGRFGLYGPLIRERFLGGLPGVATPVGYRVLRFVEVSSPPPPTLSDIAAVLLVDRARAVRVVDRLVADGLVERVQDDVDRRVRRVALTDDARRHLADAATRRAEMLGAALTDWPAEDLERLTGYLDRLNDSVVRHLSGEK